ncbi:uncharacterized protein LAJ45_11561 [Morchella importuna]|uniref:uncharacterized protein n=1 Tax=Morchella importuna TaxID=1174673 RepID=UPI001E8D0239|nr:uncharacterized protein LAJ45_11561 [Morchella importuna]KAH8144462.1 hypothetical protein LAJ45_11561 [Morchella importuna]
MDGNVGIEAYALLQRAQHGLAHRCQGHRVAVEVVAPDEEPIGEIMPHRYLQFHLFQWYPTVGKTPRPEVFRGRSRSRKTTPIEARDEIKLLGNADRFPTLQSKLSYAFSRLEGVAANQFLQYVGEEGIALPSMLRFYEILDTALGILIECVRLGGTLGTSANETEPLLITSPNSNVDACATLLQRLDNRQRAAEAKRGNKKPWNATAAPTPHPPPGNPAPIPRAAAPAVNASVPENHPSFRQGADADVSIAEESDIWLGIVPKQGQWKSTKETSDDGSGVEGEEIDGSDNESAKDLSLHKVA